MPLITIYTDGSCHTVFRLGAWVAIIILPGDKKIVLEGILPDTTHQRMELTAVLNAILYLEQNGLSDNEVMIVTDSQYVADLHKRKTKLVKAGFKTAAGNAVANTDLVKAIFECEERIHVVYTKVKAHQKKNTGTELNRDADKRCREIMREHVSNKLQ
jgi:ribonuclease HI